MKALLQRKAEIIVGLALVGTFVWAGQTVTLPTASGSTVPTTTVMAPTVAQPAVAGFTEVARAVTPAVVNITRAADDTPRISRGFHDRFRDRRGWEDWKEWMDKFDPREPRGEGMGSGVIVSHDGYILTNNHVVAGARAVTVTLPDKRAFTGTIVGRDPKTDLAVVKIKAGNLPFVVWGDASKLRVGEPVLAVGNPFGLTSTVTRASPRQ